MKRVHLIALAMMALMLAGCADLALNDESSGFDGLDISVVPQAPGVDDRSITGGGSWLREARKHYLSIFFALMKYENPVVAAFFPRGATLDVTGYRPGATPLSGTYTGPYEIYSYFRQYFKALDVRNLSIQYQLAEGDNVSSHVLLSGRIPSTGKKFDMELVYLFSFDSRGRIASCRVYYDTQVWTGALTAGGPAYLTDTRNPDDDYRVRPTSYDVGGLVSSVYDNFYAGNIPAVLGMLSPEVAIYFKGDKTTYPYAGVYTGIGGALQFVQDLAGTALPYNIERFQVTEGDRTDVVLFEEWTVFATGKSYHVHTVNSWRIDTDGLLLGFSNYPDSQEIAQAYVP